MSPSLRPVAGLLLAPGAGAGSDQPALVAIDHEVSGLGLTVERIDFPYRVAGRRRPDSPAVLEQTVRDAVESMARRLGVGTEELVLGGRSMGGRICSQVAASGTPVAGLVLVSYPLHPPGRPDRPRTGHLDKLDVPCLFVSGTRDAFGSPPELDDAIELITGPVTTVRIERGDHGLRGKDDEVVRAVAAWIGATFATVGAPSQSRPR
jgi:uncharacterized protein